MEEEESDDLQEEGVVEDLLAFLENFGQEILEFLPNGKGCDVLFLKEVKGDEVRDVIERHERQRTLLEQL